MDLNIFKKKQATSPLNKVPNEIIAPRKVQANITMTSEQKRKFMEELRIDKGLVKQLKKKIKEEPKERQKEKEAEFTFTPNPFNVFAARLFPGLSLSLAEKTNDLGIALKKANMPYLLNSYISMAILGMLLSLMIGIIGAFILAFLYPGNMIIITIIRNIFISLALPVLVGLAFFAYPSSQASSIQSKINNELPFVAMHMSAIAGSGVEPTRVFSIIATSKDYPVTSIEIRKLINQINFYGHDLITALKETAKSTSSKNLANLLSGMATTIASGGDLRFYLDKSASNTLLDYKLSRERYVEVSSTYADIYTGLLIAAPLIFMLILSIIGSMNIGGDPGTMGIIGIFAIIALNIGFLVFLKVSAPEG